jgi:hypothetical protein
MASRKSRIAIACHENRDCGASNFGGRGARYARWLCEVGCPGSVAIRRA